MGSRRGYDRHMIRRVVILSLALATVISPASRADDVAAERARLANDRIRAEEEQRTRDEAEPAEQAQAEKPAGPSESRTPAAADRIEMSRALEQLRELGALKDAGYLTDEEFQLLKQKILDGAL